MGVRMAMVGLVVVGIGCSGDNPAAPTDSPGSPPDAAVGNVVTIGTAAIVSPQTLQIEAGERVLFVNDDDVAHDMSSDTHPAHLDCPAINQVGFLSPGQSRETGNFVRAETCAFHDHLDAQNPGLLGTIIIVE